MVCEAEYEAVVGATFAYFTASVTTTNEGENKTTVKTKALASATMTNGSEIDSETIEGGVLPGFKAVKSITIKGSCGDGTGTCENIETTLSVDAKIDSAFNGDVSWYLIKKDSDEISCQKPVVGGTATDPVAGTYMTTECSNIPGSLVPDGTGAYESMFGSTTAKKTVDITVTGTTNDTYYLYVDYANNEDQNTQQGKEFSIELGFAAKAGD